MCENRIFYSAEQIKTILLNRSPVKLSESQIAPVPSLSAKTGESNSTLPGIQNHSIAVGEFRWKITKHSVGKSCLWQVIYESESDEIHNSNTGLTGLPLNLPELSVPDKFTQNDGETVAGDYLYVYDWMNDHQPDNAENNLWAVGSYSNEQLQRASARVNETNLAFAIQQ